MTLYYAWFFRHTARDKLHAAKNMTGLSLWYDCYYITGNHPAFRYSKIICYHPRFVTE
jgi:hypothetical protein